MRIGVNLLMMDPAYRGGVNTYIWGLLEGFRRPQGAHTIQLYVAPGSKEAFAELAGEPRFQIVEIQPPPRPVRAALHFAGVLLPPAPYRTIANAIWGQAARAMDDQSDVIYTPTTNLCPYNYQRPTIVSLHDIQSMHHPEFFTLSQRRVERVRFESTAKCATFIQASSQFIKQDLLAHFAVLRPEQIVVIREGVNHQLWEPTPGDTDDVLGEYKLPARFLFYPAQLWPHKNHRTVLAALKILRDRSGLVVPLVLTGAPYQARDAIVRFVDEAALGTQFHYLGKVPFNVLRRLYQKAHFVITASIYESSSLTMLEGAAARRPLIAANIPPNVEMSANLEMNLFEAMNAEDLAAVLGRIWDDEAVIARQMAMNNSRIDYYSWERVAALYLEFIESNVQGARP